MKKIVKFVFETAYGPFVAWCCTALLLFVAYAISPPLGWFGTALAAFMLYERFKKGFFTFPP